MISHKFILATVSYKGKNKGRKLTVFEIRRLTSLEGVERYKVKLIPHNPEWEKEFIMVKGELINCWGANVIDIQHVGSTAINAICAKPILDVAVQLESIQNMDIDALTDMGYDYCGSRQGNEKYHLFVLRDCNQMSLRHIHCYDKTEREFDLLVSFRDYLNTHIEDALHYQNIKIRLAEQYPNDRNAYTQGKEEFIKDIYSRL